MTWLTRIVLIGLFAGVCWVWHQVYGKGGEDGVVSCCGCGQCAFSGECVMVKKTPKKSTVDLTNPSKRI